MNNSILSKSSFTIDHKRNVTVGFIFNRQLSIVIYLDYKNSQDKLILTTQHWQSLMQLQTLNNILNTIPISAKRLHIYENLYCTTNPKTHSVILRNGDDQRLKLTRVNLLQLQMLNQCISAHIEERRSKLPMYQKCFNDIYSSVLNDVNNFSSECRRIDFISAFITNYNFQLFANDDTALFVHELQINYEQILNLIKQELLITII